MKIKIRCFTCGADPAGFNSKQPPRCIFVDHYQANDEADDGSQYYCRADVGAKREQELAKRELQRGFSIEREFLIRQ
jgi:hypothetical protein